MQWLELMGPQGIGKTTLRRQLRLFTKQRKLPVGNKDIYPLIEGLDFNRPTTWGIAPQWDEFFCVVARLYLYGAGLDLADSRRRRSFCKSMMYMSMVHEAKDIGISVLDLIGSEGMRFSYMLKDVNNIRSYFQTMPVSELGVVVLEAPLSVIVNRNEMRMPRVDDFSMWAEKGTQVCALAASVLAERTRVLRLDATRSVDENVRTIAEFAGLKGGQ